MTTPVKADVDVATQDTLTGLAAGDQSVLEEVLAFRESEQASTGLDARTFSLVKIAALIALDAPPASYLWQVANALDAGATTVMEPQRLDRWPVTIAFVADPDGYQVELVQRDPE